MMFLYLHRNRNVIMGKNKTFLTNSNRIQIRFVSSLLGPNTSLQSTHFVVLEHDIFFYITLLESYRDLCSLRL